MWSRRARFEWKVGGAERLLAEDAKKPFDLIQPGRARRCVVEAHLRVTALQRMADPAEVGAAAAFLASSDSSFMTASEVAVDGGLASATLRRYARHFIRLFGAPSGSVN